MNNKFEIDSYNNIIPAKKLRPDFEELGPNPNPEMLQAQLRPAWSPVASDDSTGYTVF